MTLQMEPGKSAEGESLWFYHRGIEDDWVENRMDTFINCYIARYFYKMKAENTKSG